MRKRWMILVLLAGLLLTACGGNGNNGNNGKTNNGGNEGNETEATADTKGAADIEGKTFILGLDDTFVPMGFRDESGELVGFDIDLAKEVAKRAGFELEFQPVDWNLKEAELDSGNIDFIWNGYSVTPEREEKVAFSQPYMDNKQIIITLADSDINSKADLAGKMVTVQGESSALEAVQKDQEFVDSLGGDLVEFPTNIECFKDVEAKRSDAIVVDEVLARDYMKKNDEQKFKVLDEDFGEEVFAVGMRKSDKALIEAVNKALDEIKEDGTFEEIRGRWFADN
ncbi:MAG: amino acid ABC transporter substrate-binding protein [Tissierellia bacterium]|nr:amino acid ABC transporter substrate-binding protein [Tissierellia bacterium]